MGSNVRRKKEGSFVRGYLISWEGEKGEKGERRGMKSKRENEKRRKMKGERITLRSSISEGETGGLSVRDPPFNGPLLCDSRPDVSGDTSFLLLKKLNKSPISPLNYHNYVYTFTIL